VLLLGAGQAPGGARADGLTIASGDNWFCDHSYQFGNCVTTIGVGDSVTWTYPAGITIHTTTECGASCDTPTVSPLWDSGFMFVGNTFTRTFDTPGSFLYYCTLHPRDMRGTIIVETPPRPTPSPAAISTPETEPSPAADGAPQRAAEDVVQALQRGSPAKVSAEAMPTSGGPPPQAGTALWPFILVAGAALVAAAAALAARGRGR